MPTDEQRRNWEQITRRKPIVLRGVVIALIVEMVLAGLVMHIALHHERAQKIERSR